MMFKYSTLCFVSMTLATACIGTEESGSGGTAGFAGTSGAATGGTSGGGASGGGGVGAMGGTGGLGGTGATGGVGGTGANAGSGGTSATGGAGATGGGAGAGSGGTGGSTGGTGIGDPCIGTSYCSGVSGAICLGGTAPGFCTVDCQVVGTADALCIGSYSGGKNKFGEQNFCIFNQGQQKNICVPGCNNSASNCVNYSGLTCKDGGGFKVCAP